LDLPRFHLAFPVSDLEAARRFYVDLLGCGIGRESPDWLDFDFFGHQITAHRLEQPRDVGANDVDGDAVPIPHFGAILPWDQWHALSERLSAAGIEFVIGPRIRFAGQVGEQATMFLHDPAGNALEFKSFRDDARVFAADDAG
jgi:extradiol dioxygenase family protein